MPSPAYLRYGGLGSSALLAVAAADAGATWPWHPNMTLGTIFAGRDGWLAPLCWLLGTGGLIAVWWLGRHAVPSLRWAYVTVALWLLPLLAVLPLASYDAYSYACQGWALGAGHDPYAAGALTYGCPWLSAVAPTWLDAPAPYGPVFLVLAAFAADAGGSLPGVLALLRLIALLGVALLAACLPVLARRRGVPPERAVWLVLACPLVPIHLVSGVHNDAVMLGLLVAGVALAATRSTWPWLAAAGALIGLAGGVKATALVVLPFLIFVGARRLVPAAALGGGAVAALAVVSFASGLGFGWLGALSGSGISVQWTSPPTAVGMTADLLGAGDGAVPVARIAGLAGLAVVLAVLWWRTRAGHVDPLLATGLALAATVALGPVFHPWYLTWPLAVLAAVLRRDSLWLLVPCAVASALCLPDGYNLSLAVKQQGAVAMTALLIFLAVRHLRARRRVPA